MGILSIILWLPLLGALLVMAVPRQHMRPIQALALAATAAPFVLAWGLLSSFDRSTSALQFVERMPWVPELGMTYALGIDGLSFPMLLLTTLMALVAVVASFGVRDNVKGYFGWLLFLETAMLGVFLVQDWFLFYMFYEITLIPMFFLIGIWGGLNRAKASMSFFLYTLAGSVLMLLGIIAVYLNNPAHNFDMLALAQAHSGWSAEFKMLVFGAFLIGLGVKIPAFPLHGWLPLAHVEAPIPVSVLLSAVLLKMGAYGLLRVTNMLPEGLDAFATLLFVLGLINIVYGALMAWRQTDLKAMVAFSSISHMGFVLIGVSTQSVTGFSGVVMQMFTHGIIVGALFLLVGMLYERAHTREIGDFSGLSRRVPVYSAVMALTLLASMGLPGLAGFISEFHVLVAAFDRWGLWVVIALVGVLITAAYTLRTIGSMFMGDFDARWAKLPDLGAREVLTLTPLVLLMVGLGVFPGAVLNLVTSTLGQVVLALK